jgi:4-hydroxy-tetrahydrodipicolinate synthase
MKVDRTDRKAWAKQHFQGFENVLMPSFTADFRELDEAGIRLDVRQSKQHGFFSTLCVLEAGLSGAEQRRMLEVATDEARGEIGVSLSLIGETLEENIALLKHAESVGASHALVHFPQAFTARTHDDVYNYVRALADSTNVGLCLLAADKFSLHHLHPSGVPMEAYERLAALDNVVALQLGGLDAGMILESFERFSDKLLVTTVHFGMLPMLVRTFGLQWSGSWTVEALQAPDKRYAVNFLQLLRDGKFDAAMEVYWKLTPALGTMLRVMAPSAPTGTSPWPMMKYQQWLTGGNGGMTRVPCMRLYDRDMQAVRGGLAAVGINCADSDDDYFTGRSARASKTR